METLMGWLHVSLCSLRGHDQLLEFETDRMLLRCVSCGHKTPGWEIGGRRPHHRYGGKPATERIRLAPRFDGERRVA